ncbi:MAG: winged helix-turn-helix domain-containing protein [Polyangiaceae bacterium]
MKTTASPPHAKKFIAVAGHSPDLEREDGSANLLRQLGADVRTMGLWDDVGALFVGATDEVRMVIVEAGARPDVAALALRALRKDPRLGRVSAIVTVSRDQVARLDPASGFDDFVLTPLVPAELYARIRALEWHAAEFSTEELTKVGEIVIDRAAHEVTLHGALVTLTAKEYALLCHLSDRRGRVVSRAELLERVWGSRYDGGPRTVDIHVRRLRAKFGPALDLSTTRGAGYKLAAAVPSKKGK